MRRADALAWLACGALWACPAPLDAQSVVEVQAGGSSLYDSYGASATLYTARYEAWLGVGWQDGFRLGGALQTSFGKDSLHVGSDVLLQRYPTDRFTIGINILTQDIRYTLVRPRTIATGSFGAAASAPNSQFFQAFSFEDPYASLRIRHLVRPQVALGFDGVFARRQSAIASAEWVPHADVSVAASAGIGNNHPYGALSGAYQSDRLSVLATYARFEDGFRRADLPYPVQSEADRENIQVEWRPLPDLTLGAARQNFTQDSGGPAPPIRASGNSLYAGYRWRNLRAQAGLYDSRSQGLSNLSSYVALGGSVGSWLDVEGYLLQSRPSVGPDNTIPVINLRERILPRLSLLQQITWDDAVTVRLGGDLVTPIGDVGVSYSIVQQPFRPDDPFQSVLSLNARLQLGRFGTTLSTTFLPDGSVAYVASASTFLYFGQFGGAQPNLVAPRIGRFVIRGRVLDDQGRPVDGAALEIDGELTFTNPEGQFLLRVRRPREVPVRMRFDEFLLSGRWEVVSMPSRVRATTEESAESVDIVLRRIVETPDATPPGPDQ